MKTKKNAINDDNDLKFTPLNIETPLKPNTKINLTPLNTLDGISINSDCNNIFIGFPNSGFTPANNLNNSINAPSTPPSTSSNIYYPSTPYPSNVPSLDKSNTMPITTPTTSNSSIAEEEEFPSELSSEELYSYNTQTSNLRSTYHTDTINPIDILRNFDLSYLEFDTREKSSTKEVDKVFEYISSSCPGILATFKAYRIPYPIATLLIKKIIKATLNNSD